MEMQVIKERAGSLTPETGGKIPDNPEEVWQVRSPLSPRVVFEHPNLDEAVDRLEGNLYLVFTSQGHNGIDDPGWRNVEVKWFLGYPETFEWEEYEDNLGVVIQCAIDEERYRALVDFTDFEVVDDSLEGVRQKVFHLEHFLLNFAAPGWYKEFGELVTVER